jgi:hypothetical protein
MRGITVKVGVDEKEKWCPFTYEFLSDFCYVCGRIGHMDKQCMFEKGDNQQFSRSLRFIPKERRGRVFKRIDRVEANQWGTGTVGVQEAKVLSKVVVIIGRRRVQVVMF